MKFFSAIAVLAAPLLVLAQTGTSSASASASTGGSQQNPINIPSSGISGVAGSTLTITWKPTTSGTVSLQLREGSANNLNAGTTIASDIENTGSYTWSIPSDTVQASDYAIEIVSPEGNNYTPRFMISSSVTASSSSDSASSTTASGSSAASSSSDHSHTKTKTDSSSASAASSTSGMTTTTSSSTTSSTSGASSAAFQSSASHTGAAPRATAAAGMMGLVALGALAL